MSECQPGCLCTQLASIPVAGEQSETRWEFFGASLDKRVTGLVVFCGVRPQTGIVMAAKFAKPVKTSP
jgi:hypothetical protein